MPLKIWKVCPLHFAYDESQPVNLTTDASGFGLGAVLAHIMPDGSERPICYASKTLTASQRTYSQMEKEAYGIVWAVEKFQQYLQGRKFSITTDNEPLTTIFGPNKALPTAASLRLLKWAITLAGYDYTIDYKPGKKLINADFFSRSPLKKTDNNEAYLSAVEEYLGPVEFFTNATIFSDDSPIFPRGACKKKNPPIASWDIAAATKKDPNLRRVFRYVQWGWPQHSRPDLQEYFRFRQNFSVEGGCILNGTKVIIPPYYQQEVLN